MSCLNIVAPIFVLAFISTTSFASARDYGAEQTSEPIYTQKKLNNTGVKVDKGERYVVRVGCIGERIVDGNGCMAVKLHGLEGWDCPLLWPLSFMKRRPFERYFALIGTVGTSGMAKRIHEFSPNHSNTIFVAPATGTLFCYFNDWCSRYGNNHGELRIVVKHLKSTSI